jgi:hypothetical protein
MSNILPLGSSDRCLIEYTFRRLLLHYHHELCRYKLFTLLAIVTSIMDSIRLRNYDCMVYITHHILKRVYYTTYVFKIGHMYTCTHIGKIRVLVSGCMISLHHNICVALRLSLCPVLVCCKSIQMSIGVRGQWSVKSR